MVEINQALWDFSCFKFCKLIFESALKCPFFIETVHGSPSQYIKFKETFYDIHRCHGYVAEPHKSSLQYTQKFRAVYSLICYVSNANASEFKFKSKKCVYIDPMAIPVQCIATAAGFNADR